MHKYSEAIFVCIREGGLNLGCRPGSSPHEIAYVLMHYVWNAVPPLPTASQAAEVHENTVDLGGTRLPSP